MARSEARLQFDIWSEGLDGASAHAKLLYCVLLTDPTINHSGVGRTTLPLWATNASLTIEEAEKALAELVDGHWVFVDEVTYEVFVRSLIRRDGVADQPYLLKGALKEALQTRSKRLRVALASELRRLPPKQPDGVSKVGRKVTYPDPHETADVLDPPPAPKPTRNPVERVSDAPETHSKGNGVGEGVGEGESSVGPNSSSVGARKRGTRIPDDFAVTAEMVAWAREKFPYVDGRAETERFRDHFIAASGQKGVKNDWDATWRNWMRTAAERAPRDASPRHLAPVQASLPSDPNEAFADLRDRADVKTASRLIAPPYLPKPQPPNDDTSTAMWARREALRYIDNNRPALLEALAERKTAG